MSRVKLLLDVAEDLRHLADSLQSVADAFSYSENESPQAEEDPAANPEEASPPEKVISLEELRTRLGELSYAGYTDEIRALIQKYGVTDLGKVDPVHYGELLREAEALQDAT